MNNPEQAQSADNGSFAIQSAGDTNISQGLSVEDMRQIIGTIASQLPQYAAIAREIVDARLADFEDRLIKQMEQQSSARPEAFKDPDFQYVVRKAQHQYARSGDSSICDSLIDLIALRSAETDRTRMSLSLNEAIDKAAVLTKNEFAELSFVFLLRYIQVRAPNVLPLVVHLNTFLEPLLADISSEASSYTYMEAQSCAKIDLGSVDFGKLLTHAYSGLFCKGFDEQQLNAHLPADKKGALNPFLIGCINDPSKKQLIGLNVEEFCNIAEPSGLGKDRLSSIYNSIGATTFFSDAELVAYLSPLVPCISKASDLWQSTPLKHLTLTSVGLALGYANLARLGLKADLGIWIK